MRRLGAVLMAAAAALMLLPARDAAALDVSARGAALIEAGTGRVLYAKNAHKRLPMASTTKVMTAIVALERGRLGDTVEIDASACGAEGSSIYLEQGEEMSLEDLLYGLMLRSGNDAAAAVAIHIAKSREAFVDMMNQKALELGAFNTHFANPSGLHDENHYTTAYDLARIAGYAMKMPEFRKIVSSEYHRAGTGARPRTFKNKNKLLWEYGGGSGVKTGFTRAAGKCLVFSAERDGMELIGAVLNCPDMFADAGAVLDYGFENYEPVTMVRAGRTVARADVAGGEKNILELAAGRDIIVPVEKGKALSCRTRVIIDGCIRAPVPKGAELGRLEVLDGAALLAACPLLAADDVPGAGIGFYFDKIIRRFAA